MPTSRTRSPGLIWAASIISATMYGCEIVWPAAMGSGAVFVGKFLHSRANESLARHLSHGFEHARVSDTSPGHLEGDHALALDRAILDWCGHFCHMVQTFGDGERCRADCSSVALPRFDYSIAASA